MTSEAEAALLKMEEVWIDYTNYRGERGVRLVRPHGMYFGSNAFHPDPQWLMIALDLEKNADRSFAMKDIHYMDIDPPPGINDAVRFHLLMEKGACNDKNGTGLEISKNHLKALCSFRYWGTEDEVRAALDEYIWNTETSA